MLPIADELSVEERDRIAERLAKRVVDRRLETAAVLFLEMHKPVAFLGGQAMLVAAPIFGTLFGYENLQRLALFFQAEENVEVLLRRIEELSREPRSRKAESRGGGTAAPERSG